MLKLQNVCDIKCILTPKFVHHLKIMIEMVSLYMISLTFGNNLCFRSWVWSSVHNSPIFPNLCLSFRDVSCSVLLEPSLRISRISRIRPSHIKSPVHINIIIKPSRI